MYALTICICLKRALYRAIRKWSRKGSQEILIGDIKLFILRLLPHEQVLGLFKTAGLASFKNKIHSLRFAYKAGTC